jgi:hypothetical protein
MGWCEPATVFGESVPNNFRRQSLQTASLIPGGKVIAASSQFLSVEIGFDFVAGSKWANPVPNAASVVPFSDPHRCTMFMGFHRNNKP